MTLNEFMARIQDSDTTVILLEGKRQLPDSDRPKLVRVASMLARSFAHVRFRTGNASGSDEAFAQGIAEVDASRLEYILPYAGHRKKYQQPGARPIALTELPEAESRAIAPTRQASPDYASLLEKYRAVPKLRAKARYLLRDTLKVTGAPEHGFLPASVGLFYADPDDPMQGGTGHTIRVCRAHGVPVILQTDWMTWPD